jgi:hypothetical protein
MTTSNRNRRTAADTTRRLLVWAALVCAAVPRAAAIARSVRFRWRRPMKRVLRVAVTGAALTPWFMTAPMAGAADTAADVVVIPARKMAEAVFDSCVERQPLAGELCSFMRIFAINTENSESGWTPPQMIVNRTVYELAENGEKLWHDEDRFYGVGLAEFTMDVKLNRASASAIVTMSCGESPGCTDVTRNVSVTWVASGEAWSSRVHGTVHAWTGLGTATGIVIERPATATGTVDGAALGESAEAYMAVDGRRGVSLERNSGNDVGFRFPTWHWIAGGTGYQASAHLDSCGSASMPGDVCAVTLIIAADWTEYGWTEFFVRRFTFEIGQDGERYPAGQFEAFGTGQFTVDRQLMNASFTGVVEFPICDGTPEGGDGPPPPPGRGGSSCSPSPYQISMTWSGSGSILRFGAMRPSGDAAGSYRVSPARRSTVQQCPPVDHDGDWRRFRVSCSDGRQEALAIRRGDILVARRKEQRPVLLGEISRCVSHVPGLPLPAFRASAACRREDPPDELRSGARVVDRVRGWSAADR